jgi:hypothetical protein
MIWILKLAKNKQLKWIGKVKQILSKKQAKRQTQNIGGRTVHRQM